MEGTSDTNNSGGILFGSTSELTAKYQILAAEYAKVRAQVTVLKKAVIEEQAKEGQMRDALKVREHTIRKKDQEMESLEFRNQQLTRRVEVLQEELDGWQHRQHSKTKKLAGEPFIRQPEIVNSIIKEELQKKIEENAQLHRQIDDMELENQNAVSELQSQLHRMERDIANHRTAIDEMQRSNQCLVDGLRQDKATLEARLLVLEQELKDAHVKADARQEQLKRVQKDLSFKLETATSIIRSQLPFLDAEVPHLNDLQPSCSVPIQEKIENLSREVSDLLPDVVSGFSTFLTYLEQHTLLTPTEESTNSATTSINKRLSLHLREACGCLQQLQLSFRQVENMLRGSLTMGSARTELLQNFLSKLQTCNLCLKKVTPYHILRLEEGPPPSCPSEVKVRNQYLIDNWQQMLAAFDKIETYGRLLRDSYMPSVMHRAFDSIIVAVTDMCNAVKDMHDNYSSIFVLMERSATMTEKQKAVDQCLLSSLSSLVTCSGKLSALLTEEMYMGVPIKDAPVATSPTSVSGLETGAERLEGIIERRSFIKKGSVESGNHDENVKSNDISPCNSKDQESVECQLNPLREKITKLEQSKEHWMLEYQLLSMKHEKLLKKTQEDVSTSNSENGLRRELENGDGLNQTTITSLLGRLDFSHSPKEERTDDTETLKQYFVGRINDLIVQRQLADSKAVTFHAEVCTMQKRLNLVEKSKLELRQELHKAQELIASLKEECHTTTNNYKVQLSTMSEHLANMNDKLTSQKDEIDQLKFAMNNLGNRKGKSK